MLSDKLNLKKHTGSSYTGFGRETLEMEILWNIYSLSFVHRPLDLVYFFFFDLPSEASTSGLASCHTTGLDLQMSNELKLRKLSSLR